MFENQAQAYARELENPAREFCAAYMDLRNLRGILDKDPNEGNLRVVESVAALLREQRYSNQKMSRLLYRECSKSLAAVGFGASEVEVSRHSIHLLVQAASFCHGPASIEASGGLGSLWFETPEHESPSEFSGEYTRISLNDLLQKAEAVKLLEFSGRSAIFSTNQPDEVFVIKFAREGDDPSALHLEGKWMEQAASFAVDSPLRFDCPRHLQVAGEVLFQITGANADTLPGLPDNLQDTGCAMAYLAHRDYFLYPNDHRKGRHLSFDSFLEVMTRNCFLLGKMAAEGIMHEAPIPLFHNRVQAMRRTDEGVYQWHLFGRLDRWLDSCKFPNFGVSGLRDFEHLRLMKPGKSNFYYCMGAHFLSILLVAGSWFRAHDMSLRGFNSDGGPVDARCLFDAEQFEKIIRDCFESYYYGFCGRRFNSEIELFIPGLVEKMIEEMGVDRHMNEFMRIADQDLLTDDEFRNYIIKCGVSKEEALAMQKGEKDVLLVTGPHLGDFNRSISIPEIVEWSAMAAGCCIAARSLGDRWSCFAASQ